ncbi:DUF5675 family protein [Paenimyroides ummariense]|uniref:DUF5675 family protein n=1 Tax=Paenimyroides ummariense TaxID=913024 RepID=UPI001FE0C1F9|nr:DUF5675 family protein [Paenimyroides ummariense]
MHGKLTLKGKHIAYTIELPWQDNKRRFSCIPEGTYILRKSILKNSNGTLYCYLKTNRQHIKI